MAQAGRPRKYMAIAHKIASLVEKYNAKQAMEILNLPKSPIGMKKAQRALWNERKSLGITGPLGISYPTIIKLAKEAGIELMVGRPVA